MNKILKVIYTPNKGVTFQDGLIENFVNTVLYKFNHNL